MPGAANGLSGLYDLMGSTEKRHKSQGRRRRSYHVPHVFKRSGELETQASALPLCCEKEPICPVRSEAVRMCEASREVRARLHGSVCSDEGHDLG